MKGSRLGPYDVTAKLGEGGMGEVWRATDTKLGRDVALKVLPAEFAEDEERLARFEREAKVLASLNHPNIAHLYGLETAAPNTSETGTETETGAGTEELTFLVMELVEGEGLDELIARGPVPVDEAIPIALQIAEALEAAHEQGIVHRDLKPANVKIRPDGAVKVLDFGLAKAWEEGDVTDLSMSPTLTRHATAAGVILGTAAYMSPEQARGKPVDKRSDIWAFGVVLWEMLTGRKLFDGETVSDLVAAVLKTDIDVARLPESTPPAVRRLVRRCLERNSKNRLHDVADARIVLDEVASGRVGESPTAVAEASGPRRPAWPLAAVALTAGLAVGAVAAKWLWAPGAVAQSSAPHRELEIAAPLGHQLVSGLALSADGLRLAFVARGEDGRTALWVRSLDEAEATVLPGTIDARYPFWSPDGRRLGFFSQGRLKVTDLLGGSPRILADTGATVDVRGGSWGADGYILYTPTFVGPIFAVPAEGGTPEPATRIPEGSDIGTQRFPCFLPDGRRFLFYSSTGTGIEPGDLYLGRLGSLETKRLGPAASAALFAPPGFVLYIQGDSLVARRFDETTEELVGEPIPLGIALPGSVSVSGQRSLAVSQEGTLVYRADKRNATRLVWVDRRGEELGTVHSESEVWHYGPRLSPDGRRLVVSHYQPGSTSGGLWIHDLERGTAFPVTFGETSDDSLAVWSPDGTELAYASVGGDGQSGIFRVDVRRPEGGRMWFPRQHFVIPSAWLRGGAGLVYLEGDEAGRFTLWRADPDGGGEPQRLGPPQGSETNAVLSPDGSWIAFGSDATRRREVYLRRLDDPTAASTIRVSTDGGDSPRWRGDGRELFYVDDNGRMMAVPIQLGERPEIGSPQPLFDARLEESADAQYDVSADGQRFILNRTLLEDHVPIEVVLGWQVRLERGTAP